MMECLKKQHPQVVQADFDKLRHLLGSIIQKTQLLLAYFWQQVSHRDYVFEYFVACSDFPSRLSGVGAAAACSNFPSRSSNVGAVGLNKMKRASNCKDLQAQKWVKTSPQKLPGMSAAQRTATSSASSSALPWQQSEITFGPQTSNHPDYSEIFYGAQMPERRPAQIHGKDTRFVVGNKDRIFHCDICWQPFGWQGRRPTHWGNYMHINWVGLGGPALEYGYENRYIDVTWHCVGCEMERRGLHGNDNYYVVAEEMNVFREVQRRQQVYTSRKHIFEKK